MVVFGFVNTFRLGIGADLRAECSVGARPTNWVSCDFTNMGYVPGRICAAARGAAYGSDLVITSETLCSGVLLPLSQKTVTQTDRIGGLCLRGECEITTILWP